MIYMTAKAFIDTNIWVYAHLEQENDNRCNKALDLLESLPELTISTQVLHEYYSVMLKYKIQDEIIQDNIEAIITACEISLIDVSVIRSAHQIRLKYRFSYWDSLMIASAIKSHCVILYSEDMQHLQIIETVKIINPFMDV